uniref:Uncharacterized protein n=1 Tax=Manihot esculenta TaxID=3983 RepID=A0A2C9VXX1_MANES
MNYISFSCNLFSLFFHTRVYVSEWRKKHEKPRNKFVKLSD